MFRDYGEILEQKLNEQEKKMKENEALIRQLMRQL
jgi:hypothetical protein